MSKEATHWFVVGSMVLLTGALLWIGYVCVYLLDDNEVPIGLPPPPPGEIEVKLGPADVKP